MRGRLIGMRWTRWGLWLACAGSSATWAADGAPAVRVAAAVAAAKAAMMANPGEALTRAQEAKAIAAGIAGPREREAAQAEALWLEGEATSRLDRPDKAIPMLETALREAAQAGAGGKLVADILLSRGWAESAIGLVAPAMTDFQGAYERYRTLGEVRGQAKALQNIGGIYHDAGDDARSLSYHSQVADLAGDDAAIALAAHNNLGETLKALGRYRQAETEYQRALAKARELGSALLEARILTNLASAQLHLNELDEAARTAGRALVLTGGEAASERPFALGLLAEVAEKKGDDARAAALLGETFAGQDLTRTTLPYRDLHEVATRVYARLGDDGLAFRHLSAFKRLDDGARALAASTNAALMSARFDFANQRRRIVELKAGQERRDRALVESRARFQAILFSGALGAGGVVLAILAVSVVSLRRSRNEVRAANDQLSDTNASLEKALKVKSEFLATTSHEIRTPLNGILGMTQVMLADPGVQPDLRERIQIVHGAGETMKALVDDILDLAKIENGNLEVTMAPIDLAALVRETARFWRGPAEGKGLALNLELDTLPARVMGDRTRLRQVLFNLMSNAVKFTPAGSVTLRATREEGRAILTIADTGIGIPADKLEAIFERFYQVDSQTSRQFSGTGLGLAISRHLAMAMGGTIGVASRPGEGSAFRLELPLEIAADERDEEAADSPERNGVLVLEPNPLAQRMLAKGLGAAFADVQFAVDPDAATAALGRVRQLVIQADALAAERLPALIGAAREAGVATIVMHTPDAPFSTGTLAAFSPDALLAKPLPVAALIACCRETAAGKTLFTSCV